MASLACATTGSIQLGTTRSGRAGPETRAAGGRENATGPSAGADGPVGALLTRSVCRARRQPPWRRPSAAATATTTTGTAATATAGTAAAAGERGRGALLTPDGRVVVVRI